MKKKIIYLLILAMFTLAYSSSYAQDKEVKGKITDALGLPLPGANVLIKGTNKAVSTDSEGVYKIKVAVGQVLVYSFTGSKSEERIVGSSSNYDVTLTDSNSNLDEVVFVGYGVRKKKDLTGSVVSVNAKEIASRPVTNAVQAIQGKAAGVDISSNERPGTVGNIRIRGSRSISATNSPLYVVDGIPLNTGGIDFINPTDIESIDILKDASATAIYGSRGANGVVIVTTKKGKTGKFNINYDSSVMLEDINENARMMNSAEYIELRRWARFYENPTLFARGDAPTIANDRLIFLDTADPAAWANFEKGWAGGTWDGSKVATTDWAKFVTQTAATQFHTLSVSGGTEKMKSYGSFGFLDNVGTLKGQSYRRYNGTVNVDITPKKWFQMGANLNTSYGINEFGQSNAGRSAVSSSGGIYQTARQNLPYAVPFDAQGNRIQNPGGDATIRNVYDEHLLSQDQRITLRAFGSLYSQVDLGALTPVLDGLKYRVNFGPDITMYRNGVFLDANSSIRSGTIFAALSKAQEVSYTLDHLLLYNKTIGSHDFGLTLLQSQTEYSNENNSVSAERIPNPANKWNALTPANVVLQNYGSDLIETSLLSYMARVNYSYKDKYLITASGRYDGASQLAPGNKWAFFPSTALAWSIDKESFLQNISWLNQLKLRAGFGITGNAAVNAYATQPPLVGIVYPSGSGLIHNTSLGNTDLSWEKTAQFNYGIDFSLFNNRVSGSLEYYTSNTTDLLLSRTIPTVTGFFTTFENVGATSGNGFEITLNTVNVKKSDFEWTSSLSASFQRNRIVELQNGKFDDINNRRFIGQPQGIIFGFASNGIWKPEDAEEMAKFNANGSRFTFGNARPVDQNGDYRIDANNDRVIIGSTEPRFIAGLTNTFNYKNFELSMFVYGRFGYMFNTGGENLSGKTSQRAVNYYTENNTNSEYQKPVYSAASGDPFFSVLGYRDGSFLKIRNISLGYNFTDAIAKKIGVEKLRMYLQAANPGMLFTKTRWMDFDTETTFSNRGLTFGLNVQF